jgi:hypothetical protein
MASPLAMTTAPVFMAILSAPGRLEKLLEIHHTAHEEDLLVKMRMRDENVIRFSDCTNI